MLSDATAGKFTHVIVRDYDRLSRDDREGPSFVYMLQDGGGDSMGVRHAGPRLTRAAR
jgi:DNA invertase Pin-like site-specific DNA recombinase